MKNLFQVLQKKYLSKYQLYFNEKKNSNHWCRYSRFNSCKFNKEKFASKLDLVTRDEFNVLKKIIEKQQKEITNIKKKKSKR